MEIEFKLSEKQFRVAVILAIIVAGFMAYANSFANGFVWDDVSSVLLNKHIQSPSWFFQFFREDQHPFGRGQGNFYRPLVAASFMVDYALTKALIPAEGAKGLNPVLFHFTNTLWHIGAALLLFTLLARLRAPRLVSAAVSLLYLVHPLHTEAVTYISGRADSMAAVFMFAGLRCALWHSTPRRRILGIIGALLCFCAGLLSKESAMIFPVLLLLVLVADPVAMENRKREYLIRAVPLGISVILLAVYGVLRMTVLHFGTTTSPDTTFGQRLTEMFEALALYFRLIFVPTGLHMERTLTNVSGWTAFAGFLLLAGMIAALLFSLARKQRRIALGLAWFVVSWLPISGIFPLNAPMAEHWLYVPLAGLLLALIEALRLVLPARVGRAALIPVLCAAGLLFTGLTVHRNIDWRDNEHIFLATLAKNPASDRVHYNLAVTYEDLLGNLPGAKRQYEAVLQLYKTRKALERASGPEKFWEDELESHLSLGKIYAQERQFQQAADQYTTVLRASTTDAYKTAAALGLGKCFLALGDTQHALEIFRQLAKAHPDLKEEIATALRGGEDS